MREAAAKREVGKSEQQLILRLVEIWTKMKMTKRGGKKGVHRLVEGVAGGYISECSMSKEIYWQI